MSGSGESGGGREGSRTVRVSVALYRLALRRYPRRLRDAWGEEMVAAFRSLLEDQMARRGWRGALGAWWRVAREMVGPTGRTGTEGGGDMGEKTGQGRRWLRGGMEDARFAWRSLRRDLRFTVLLVGVLGVGMALNVSVFSVVNAYLLRPLPYPAAERIVTVRPVTDLSWTAVDDVMERAVSWDLDVFTLVGGDEGPQMVRGSWVTPDFMDVYDVRAALGRTFRPDEAGAGGAPVAMISHRLWQDRFRGDPGVIGRSFEAFTSDRPDHAESFTVVGVLPRDFWYVNDFTEVFVPIRDERALYVGRLRADVPLEAAEAVLTERARAATAGLPEDFRIRLTRVQDIHVAAVRPTLAVLQGAVLLVLLIASANAVVLLLIRSARREQELGVRRALGAPRARLARQLGAEGMLLGFGAGMVGLAMGAGILELARWGVPGMLGGSVPGGAEALHLDGTVALATAVVCGCMGILFGGVPAGLLLARRTTAVLGSGTGRGGSDTRGRRRVRSVLVMAEVALSMALLAGAGLMVRSAVHLQTLDLGFDPSSVTRGTLGLRQSSYPDVDGRVAFFESVVQGVRGLPDVQAAGLASNTPFSGFVQAVPFESDEGGEGPARAAEATAADVGDGYFHAMDIALLRGRGFTPADRVGAPPVAVVSASLAARLWPGVDPLGRRLRLMPFPDDRDGQPGHWHTVVGVVEDVTRDLRVPSDGQVYAPYRQQLGFWMTLVVRRRPGAGPVEAAVQGVVSELDAEVPFSGAAELEDLVGAARAPTRFTAWLLGGFASFALALSLIGLYGVVAYAARQLRRDVAIRMALGADRGSVTGYFLRQGLVVVAGGLGVGLAGGLLLGRALAGQLQGVAPDDPLVHGGVALGLLITAALAVWIPARGAGGVGPMDVLRE
ncbi:MAG: ADOP family duplicated permease [Longimicrobiales bacterium]